MPQYELVQADDFEGSIKAFGDYRRLDDATVALADVLCSNPEIYPVIEGMRDVRLCLTDYSGDVPAA